MGVAKNNTLSLVIFRLDTLKGKAKGLAVEPLRLNVLNTKTG